MGHGIVCRHGLMETWIEMNIALAMGRWNLPIWMDMNIVLSAWNVSVYSLVGT